MLIGTINHLALTVSDLPEAMKFFRPFVRFLGYEPEGAGDGVGTDVVVCISAHNGSAINLRQAKPELAARPFDRWVPGLHHVAFNAASHNQVDELAALVPRIGGTILDPAGEHPYAIGGYYAVYFSGPDGMKFEFVHMPELERAYCARQLLNAKLLLE